MPLYRIALLSFIAVITMVNPLAVVPSFIALTDGTSRRTRAAIAHGLPSVRGKAASRIST